MVALRSSMTILNALTRAERGMFDARDYYFSNCGYCYSSMYPLGLLVIKAKVWHGYSRSVHPAAPRRSLALR